MYIELSGYPVGSSSQLLRSATLLIYHTRLSLSEREALMKATAPARKSLAQEHPPRLFSLSARSAPVSAGGSAQIE